MTVAIADLYERIVLLFPDRAHRDDPECDCLLCTMGRIDELYPPSAAGAERDDRQGLLL